MKNEKEEILGTKRLFDTLVAKDHISFKGSSINENGSVSNIENKIDRKDTLTNFSSLMMEIDKVDNSVDVSMVDPSQETSKLTQVQKKKTKSKLAKIKTRERIVFNKNSTRK